MSCCHCADRSRFVVFIGYDYSFANPWESVDDLSEVPDMGDYALAVEVEVDGYTVWRRESNATGQGEWRKEKWFS